jgi:Flp pilus assembly protein CpaB
VTRRSIILVACGVLTIVVGIAVALLSSDQSAPANPTTVEADADADAGTDTKVASGAPVAEAPAASRPEVPEGTEAVAIDASFVAGGAGFAAAGDQVNVFALVDDSASAVAVLSDVTVLEVSATTGASGTSSGSGTPTTPKQITYVLAVPIDEVETLVRAAGFNRLYVTFPSEGSPPRPTAAVGATGLGDAASAEVAP